MKNKNYTRNLKSFLVVALAILFTTGLKAQKDTTNNVTYVGGTLNDAFNHSLQLSDSTFLVAGSTEKMGWVPQDVRQELDVSNVTIKSNSSGTFAFLMHVNKKMDSILNFVHFPDETVANVFKIKSTNPPGEPTDDIYISGLNEGGSERGYFIARLNNNFVDGVPTAPEWVYNIEVEDLTTNKTSFDNRKSWHRYHQPWDVNNNGTVVLADGEDFKFSFSWLFVIDSTGKKTSAYPYWTDNTVAHIYKGKNLFIKENLNNEDSVHLNDLNNLEKLEKGDTIKEYIKFHHKYFQGKSFTEKFNIIDTSVQSMSSDSMYAINKDSVFNFTYDTAKGDFLLNTQIAMKVAGTSFRGLRSISQKDYNADIDGENGATYKGKFPNDYIYNSPCDSSTHVNDCKQEGPGFYGHKPANGRIHTVRIGDISFDKRNNKLYLGYTIPSEAPLGKGYDKQGYGFNFISALVAFDSNGKIDWYARMNEMDQSIYQASSAQPPHLLDHLAIDYKNDRIVAAGRTIDAWPVNFWKGNNLKNKPDGEGFQNMFTGTKTNVEYSWLGSYGLNDGDIYHSTYVAEYDEGNPGGQIFENPLMDEWPDPNTGDPDISETRIKDLSVGPDGKVAISGWGGRVITTKNAFQKMIKPKSNTVLDQDRAGGASFVRVYNHSLDSVKYSSLLESRWNTETGIGNQKSELNSILPLNDKLLVTGSISGEPASGEKALAQINPASFGNNNSKDKGLFASLSFNCGEVPDIPGEGNKNLRVCLGDTIQIGLPTDTIADKYNWSLPDDPNWVILGDSTQDTIRITFKDGAASGLLDVTAENSCGKSHHQFFNIKVDEKVLDKPDAINPPDIHYIGETASYIVENGNTDLIYQWDLPGSNWEGSSNKPQIDLLAKKGNGGILSVKVKNGCGFSTESRSLQLPPPCPEISKDHSILLNSEMDVNSTYELKIDKEDTNATGYKWSIPDSFTADTLEGKSIMVTPGKFADNGSANFSLTVTNSCDTVTFSASTMVNNPCPEFTSSDISINKPTNIKADSVYLIEATGIETANSYKWELPQGWKFSSKNGKIIGVRPTVHAKAGNLKVTISDNCGFFTASKSVSLDKPIGANPCPEFTKDDIVIDIPKISKRDSTYFIVASKISTADSYTWDLPSEWKLLVSNENVIGISPTTKAEASELTLKVKDTCDLHNVTKKVALPEPTGLNADKLFTKSIDIYPNPVREIVNIQFQNFSERQRIIRVYNSLGEKVKLINIKADKKSFKLDLSGKSSGLYHIEIIEGNKRALKSVQKQ